jgi:inner membrane protein involved in colicin E2 resistance
MNYYSPLGLLFGLVGLAVVVAWLVALVLGAAIERDLAYAAAGIAVVASVLRVLVRGGIR